MAFKVLLADDSPPAKNLGKKILEEAGYEVVVCSNGLEASRKIAETSPDLAILDIFMPGYTGLEVCGRLRENPATEKLPVILMVGKMEPYRPEEGEQVRADAVVIKPFSEDELISAVRKLIGSPYGSRKAFAQPGAAATAPKISKPLLEWWDPATEAIERSIAAARQRRSGVVPASAEGGPGGRAGSAEAPGFTQEPHSEQDDEGDPRSLVNEPDENFAVDLAEEAGDDFLRLAATPQNGQGTALGSVLQEVFGPEAQDAGAAVEDKAVWPEDEQIDSGGAIACEVAEATAQADWERESAQIATAIIATAMSVANETAPACEAAPASKLEAKSPPAFSLEAIAPATTESSSSEARAEGSAPVAEAAAFSEAERIRGAVEKVFERFRPQIVEAVLRELNQRD